MFRLDDKVVVVVGSSGCLGHQFCGAIVEQGGICYGLDIADPAEETLDGDGRFTHLTVDCTSKQDMTEAREKIVAIEGRVDVLVVSVTMKGDDFYLPFEDVSLEGWQVGLMGNLTVNFLAAQAFMPVFVGQGSGSIINISSIYGIVGNDQSIYEGSNLHEVYAKSHPEIDRIYSHGVYNAAKGGLINFTRYLAAYYGKNNIRVNCISPGGISNEGENSTFVEKYSQRTPLGRKAKPDEINGAVVFLASDESSYVTGHNLVVDGGYTIW